MFGAESMRERRQRRSTGDDGATLVEFALILPVLLMLLLGILTGGAAYNQKLDATHATREGARWAATIPSTQAFTTAYVGAGFTNTWANGVRRYVVNRSAGTLSMSQVCVALVSGPTPTVVGVAANNSTSGAPCFTDDSYPTTTNDPGRRVQVSVSRPGTIDLGVFPSVDFTISSQAVAKCETTL